MYDIVFYIYYIQKNDQIHAKKCFSTFNKKVENT